MRGKFRMAGVCLAALILTGGCGEALQEQESHIAVENGNDKIVYDYVTVEIGDVALTDKIECVYKQQAEQAVGFAATGRKVTEVYVKEGDYVRKGALLAELNAGSLREQAQDLEYRIARNELLLEHMELNKALDRSESWVNYLFNHFLDEEGNEKNLEAIEKRYRYQREDCEDALELDRAELVRVEQELAECYLYAGMGGLVYKVREGLAGSTSKAGEAVITIVDDSRCLFEMQAPEYAAYFPEGAPVAMKIARGSAAGEYEILPYERKHWGETQQFSVLSGPAVSGLEMGTRGTIELVLDSRTGVLCVPKGALHSADGRYYVYVTDQDNMRQIRWVEAGLIGDVSAEITGGLEAGERVVHR